MEFASKWALTTFHGSKLRVIVRFLNPTSFWGAASFILALYCSAIVVGYGLFTLLFVVVTMPSTIAKTPDPS